MKPTNEHRAHSRRWFHAIGPGVACVAIGLSLLHWWSSREERIRQDLRTVEMGARVAELERKLEVLERFCASPARLLKGDFPPWYGRDPGAKPRDSNRPTDVTP